MSHDEFAASCTEGHPIANGDSFCSKCGAKSSTDGSKQVAQENAFGADAGGNPSPKVAGNGLSARFSRKALIVGAAGISALVLLLLTLLSPSGSTSDFGIPGLTANQPLLHCVTPLAADLATLTSKSIDEATRMANDPFAFGLSPTSAKQQAIFSAYGTYVSAVSSGQSKGDAYVTGVREISTFCRGLLGEPSSSSRPMASTTVPMTTTTATATAVPAPSPESTTQPIDAVLPSTTTTTSLIEVPFLIRKTPGEASALLQAVGLILGSVTPSAPDPNGPCVGDNSTWNIPSGSIQGWTVRGSKNGSYVPAGSIVDVTVCP